MGGIVSRQHGQRVFREARGRVPRHHVTVFGRQHPRRFLFDKTLQCRRISKVKHAPPEALCIQNGVEEQRPVDHSRQMRVEKSALWHLTNHAEKSRLGNTVYVWGAASLPHPRGSAGVFVPVFAIIVAFIDQRLKPRVVVCADVCRIGGAFGAAGRHTVRVTLEIGLRDRGPTSCNDAAAPFGAISFFAGGGGGMPRGDRVVAWCVCYVYRAFFYAKSVKI